MTTFLILAGMALCILVVALGRKFKTRKQERFAYALLFASCGLSLAVHGRITHGWAGLMSEEGLGICFLIMGVLGLLGVNVWIGSLLDPRDD